MVLAPLPPAETKRQSRALGRAAVAKKSPQRLGVCVPQGSCAFRARFLVARASYRSPRQPSHTSAAVPARCAFKAANCSSRRPRAPPTGGRANFGLYPSRRGSRGKSGGEVKLIEPSRHLLSSEYCLNQLFSPVTSDLLVQLAF